MKISIISDVHLGFGQGREIQEDSFEAFSEALEKSRGCDLILLGGDIFDSRTPSTEVLTKAMELLITPISTQSSTRLVSGIGKDVEELTPLHEVGIPVVSIHGTHERRVKDLINPIQALEKAGFLIHLHVNGIVLEKDGERICIQGMSGVPEQFSGAVLDRWNPKPVKGCFNILMLHQSISPFMYASHLLPLESVPKGFDLYILGHIHESKLTEYSGSPLIIPGSLVATQLTKESEGQKGFWVFDTIEKKGAFIPLESQRKVYHIDFEGEQKELEEKLSSVLSSSHDKKPIIRIKSTGLDAQGLSARFGELAMISIREKKLEESDAPKAVSIKEQFLSVKELGRKLLSENLARAELDTTLFSAIFDLLANKKPEEGLRLLRQNRKNLQVVQ